MRHSSLPKHYNTLYRFDDAVMLLEEQIQANSKKKQPVDDLEKLLEKDKSECPYAKRSRRSLHYRQFCC